MKINQDYFGIEFNQTAKAMHSDAMNALEQLMAKTCRGAEYTGWFDWPAIHGFKLAEDILKWQRSLTVDYDIVVVIGIGGSYLGAKAISDLTTHQFVFAAGTPSSSVSRVPVVFAGHNISETNLSELLDLLATKKPIVNVISKSGTTTEPGLAFRVLRTFMESKFPDDHHKRVIATTDGKKGSLRELALASNFKMFEVPDDVGGRFSVLTAVGLVPLALHGFDIFALLQGADRVFQNIKSRQYSSDDVATTLNYAACRTAAWKAGKRIEVLAYPEPKMRNIAEWWKQLYGESDGKNGLGLFPASIECTMDLHSMGQYMQEGARTMIETFLRAELPRKMSSDSQPKPLTCPRASSNLDGLQYLESRPLDEINKTAFLATRVAHSQGGVPALELLLPDFTPRSLGAMIAIFETSCAVGGILLGVNSFDQPGVEAYKQKMFQLLGKPQ